MSYNITGWKIRSIRLELPINFDFQAWVREQPNPTPRGYENVGKRWCLEDRDSGVQCNLAEGKWTLEASGKTITGVIQGEKLLVTDPHALEWTDDGSGHLYSDILIPLFKDFKDNLNAMVIWEGGDSVRSLDISDGIVRDEEIE